MKPFKDLSTNEKLDAVLRHLNDLYTKERLNEHVDTAGVIIYRQTQKQISNALNYTWGKTYGNEMRLILDYLIDVKQYIKKDAHCTNEDNQFVNGYSILYAGKVFIEDGGFTAKENSATAAHMRESAQVRRLEDVDTQSLKNQKDLNYLTSKLKTASWAAAFGTGALAVIEIIKYVTSFFLSNSH